MRIDVQREKKKDRILDVLISQVLFFCHNVIVLLFLLFLAFYFLDGIEIPPEFLRRKGIGRRRIPSKPHINSDSRMPPSRSSTVEQGSAHGMYCAFSTWLYFFFILEVNAVNITVTLQNQDFFCGHK